MTLAENMRAWLIVVVAAGFTSCVAGGGKVTDHGGTVCREWGVAIGHLGIDAYSSSEFAAANFILEAKVRTLERGVLDRIECHIVPRPEGYQIVLLSHRQLSTAEEERVLVFVNESLSAAIQQRLSAKNG